jgi:hypothetical protein
MRWSGDALSEPGSCTTDEVATVLEQSRPCSSGEEHASTNGAARTPRPSSVAAGGTGGTCGWDRAAPNKHRGQPSASHRSAVPEVA